MRQWNGVAHPDWCDVDRCAIVVDGEGRHHAVEHMSRPIACNPNRDEQVALSVCLWRPAHGREPTAIRLEALDEQCAIGYPLLLDQAVALRDAISALVGLDRRLDIVSA
jgi:hypothetical protein